MSGLVHTVIALRAALHHVELWTADLAGGPAHTALFLENAQGFEVEIVAS